jgi:ATP-dependent Lon protease
MANKKSEQVMPIMAISEDDTEFIPLLTEEEEEKFEKEEVPSEIAILPLRNNVLFPGVVIPITVGRDKSIQLIKDVTDKDGLIGVFSQKNSLIEEPEAEDLNPIGTIAQVLRTIKMPDGSTTAIIQGKKRIQIQQVTQVEPYLAGQIIDIPEERVKDKTKKYQALIGSLKDLAHSIIKESPDIPSEATIAIQNIHSDSFLINFICSNLPIKHTDKQELLSIDKISERGEKALIHLQTELEMLKMKNEIQNKTRKDLDQQQREYFLNQQMRTIQEELGDIPGEKDIDSIKKRAKNKKWNDKTKAAFDKELGRLKRMNPQGADYSVQLNYLETIVDLPWNEYSQDVFDLQKSQEILDRDHHGLKKVKERIIEYLAVLKLKGDMKAPIICLHGPPGVGKTSLGRSIAESLGRKYARIALGGLHDESEIRGHRKTYIGAMPGKIIQNLKKAECSNPVFILDEIDKLGQGSHGDPSSAMLEVLDPEQNSAFTDNYVDLDFDLSKVLFIATANNLNTIQPALRDRMEMIEVNGYTVEEKVEIAKKHLIPKQIKEHGLKPKHIKFSKAGLVEIIDSYTGESGVRGLEKVIAKLIRNKATQVAMEKEDYESSISKETFLNILGPSYSKDKYIGNDFAGVVTGLAWTQIGGDILFIESILNPGTGKLNLTGNLGDVMKESAVIALEYFKSIASEYDVEPEEFKKNNIHIHVPEGATPKDGPSAGITMLTSIASVFTQRKVKKYLAMTGEITLRGAVLPVGGIKEKILAAKRANIKEIILSRKNEKHITDIEEYYKKGLTFHFVETMQEVLKIALLETKVK